MVPERGLGVVGWSFLVLFLGASLTASAAEGEVEASGSALVLPIRFPAQLLLPAIGEAFPVETDWEDAWREGAPLADGSKLRFQIYFFRGPATVAVADGGFEIAFDEVQYRMRVEVTRPGGEIVAGRCGYGDEWPRRARLEARADVSWAADWTLATRTEFAAPVLLDPCRLDDGTDLGPAVEAGLAGRLEATAGAIDAALAERAAALRRVETLWRALGQAVELAPGVWLRLRPRDVVAGPIGGADETLETAIGLTLDPEATLAEKVEAESLPLPELHLAAVADRGLRLEVPLVAPYEEVGERLAADLVGTELSVLGRTGLRIESARAYRSDSSLGVEMEVSGVVDGTAQVVGRPWLESDGSTVTLRYVEATIETSGRFAGAMGRLAEKALASAVEDQGRIELDDRLNQIRNALLQAVNREVAPGIWLQGDVTEVRAESLELVEAGVEVRLLVEATIRVELR